MADVIDHKSRGHARFGASSAARWFACPGSVKLCDMVEKRSSGAAADEGTRAHELLETMLRVHGSSDAAAKEAEAPQDMRDAVRVAFDYVQDILANHPDAVMLVEHSFEIPVAAAPREVWGTCDVVIFVPSLRLLYVIDYKHGAGVFVDVRGNKQLRFYGLGALASQRKSADHFGGKAESFYEHHEIDTVALVIIQPRCAFGEPVREEWLPVEDLLEFGKEIGAAVEAAKAPDAPLVPGEEQCRFCPAKVSCPARERQARDAAGADFGHVAKVGAVAVPAAPELTNERIADVLDARPLVEAWFEAVEQEAFARMSAGQVVRDRKLVEVQARRQWEGLEKDTNGEGLMALAESLSKMSDFRPEDFTTVKMKTLAEVEAILKKGVDRTEARRRLDAMAFLTTKKSSGKLTIAPESDPRPAASKAADAFGGVQQVEVK